jgi:phospholipase C
MIGTIRTRLDKVLRSRWPFPPGPPGDTTAGFVSIEGSETLPTRFLRPNDFAEISFTPMPGPLKVTVSGAQVGGTKVPGKFETNHKSPEDGIDVSIKQKQNVKLRLTLFTPNGEKAADRVLEFKDMLNSVGTLSVTIPANQAGKQWRARVMNVGRNDVRAGLSATFMAKRHMAGITAIPLRVLNNAAQQAIEALGLVIHLDGNNSFVDFSPDLKKLSGERIKRKSFSVPSVVKDINLKTLRAQAITRGQRAFIRILVDFETAGTEIQLAGIPLINITKAAVVVELELQVSGEPGKRRLLPLASVSVDFAASNLPANSPLFFMPDEEWVKDAIRNTLLDTLNDVDMVETVGKYVTEGLVQLSRRGHAFHNLTVDSRNFLVEHYDPNITLGPQDKLLTPIPPLQPTDPFPVPKPASLEPPVNLDKIEHIVVLMQENRSFDHMVGYLRLQSGRTDVDGLTGKEGNTAPELGISTPVLVNPLSHDLPYSPHHEHDQVLLQVAEGKMSGFVRSYLDRFPGVDPRFGMGFFGADQVPTFDFFAREFLLCDRWFCSHPGPTQPNRFATLSGQIPQLDNFDVDDPALGFVQLPTIFDHLTAAGISWVYYEQDLAFLRYYNRYRLDDTHVIPFHDEREGFFARARSGTLPSVTFIDPNFVDVPPLRTANDDHPPANICSGQEMMACIYDTLIRSPQWGKTLFVITYDEHGGFYDHVPPPGISATPSIAKLHPNGPSFLGVRVPTFVISPWVGAGDVSHTIFDHTSLAKTILLRFLRDKMPDMGPRVSQAAHLGILLTNDKPRLEVPRRGTGCPPRPFLPPKPPEEFDKLPPHKAERNDFHEAVRRFGKPKL